MRRAPSLSGPPAKADISVGALSATTPKPERNVSWSSSAVSNGKRAVPRLKAVGSQSTSVNSTMAGVTGNLPFTDKKLNYATRETALKISASIEEQVTTDRIETDSSSVDDFTSYGSGFGVPDLLRVSSRLLPTKSKPEALRKRALKDASFQEQVPQRISCRNPATALDPHLERAIAVFITEIPDRPQKNAQKYLVTPRDRIQLTANQDILKHVDSPFETEKPKLVRIETTVVDPTRRAGRCISSLLRSRELGLDSWGRNVETHGELRLRRIEMIEPWKYWKGASGDIVAVAWAPNSNIYAAGAAAHTNFEDIQYNRPCNLLLGDLSSNTIRELPDHRVDRPKPETIANGPNATRAVYNACDPKVYETITSIGFSVKGDRMFTASHDRTVKVWKFSDGQYQCLRTLHHGAPVTSIEVSKHGSNLFATASKCIENSVRVYYSQDPEDTPCFVNYSSPRAEARPEWRIYPECLRWGSSQHTSHLLLAGFQQWEAECDGPQLEGQLCLWDANAFQSIKVTPGSQSVFATAWHPTLPFFATGGAPKASLVVDKQNTKTVVRTWDLRTPKRYSREYECPALDMQDITFSPIHANIVTAGCTDGSSYIWDARRPDNILHRLQHGRPLADLDHTRSREEADTGVMMSLWSPGGSLFYTGSSDGAIKAWDVRRHPNDVLTNNIAQFGAGIQSGAFSPDGINLLVGDADGAVHVLSSAPCGPRFNSPATEELIELVKAPDGSGLRLEHDEDNPGTEGTEAANALIASGELEYNAEYGVGKGPNYEGPYAKYARKESIEPEIGRLRKKFERVQPFSKHGEKRDVIADRMSCLLSERKVALNHPISTRPQWSNGCVLKPVSDIHDDPVGAIPESEMVEEHHWWPRLGEDEVTRAREKALAGRG